MNPRVLLKGLGLLLSLALFGYFFQASDLGNSMNEGWIDAHIRDQGITGNVLFLATSAAITGVGMPRQIVAFLAGYAYGLPMGTFMGTLGAVIGSAITFFYARLFARNWLSARLGARAHRFDAFVHEHPFLMSLLVRLLPVGSNLLTNLAAGISHARTFPFLSGSFIGFLPQSFIFALVGSGIEVSSAYKVAIAAILFVFSCIIGAYLYHRYRHGLSIDDEVDQKLGENGTGE